GRLHDPPFGTLDELDLYLSSVAHTVFNELLGHDARIGPLEIEAILAVLRFHARQELAALAQVDLALGRVPVVRGVIPFLDVARVVPGVPDRRPPGFDDGL